MASLDFSALRIAASRRDVTAVMCIDTSYSMTSSQRGTTRIQAATDGACRVVDSLGEGDHVALLAFGHDLDDVSGGFVELSGSKKASIKRDIKRLQATGRSTKLYDTVLAGCHMVLSIAAIAKGVGQAIQEDFGTFWLVILTDGDDNSSSASLADAKQVLRQINAELGPSIMKIAFIGVQLSGGPRRVLQELSQAGGSMSTFVDAKDLKQVTEAFDEIAVQIVQARVSMGISSTRPALIDDSTPWVGNIQKGSHVRCVGQSRGGGAVDIGDVGVVKARDSDGDYFVDFPKQDNWCGQPRDLVVDTDAEKVRPGALVVPKASVSSPVFGWGSYQRGMHGLVVNVRHDGVVSVQFGFDPDSPPTDNLWRSQLKELEVVDAESLNSRGPWPGKLQLGQAVRVPLNLNAPSTGWGSLKRGEIGYVRAYKRATNSYVCDFPSADGWQGRPQDLVVDAVATLVRPGKQVRIRQGITPKYGWGHIKPDSIGTVISIRYDGDSVIVNFPEDSTWKGTIADLKTLDGPRKPSGDHSSDRPREPSGDDSTADSSSSSSQMFPNGAVIVMKGFNTKKGAPWNGKMAKVISKQGDRYAVQPLDGDSLIKVRETNLMTPRQIHKNGTHVTLRGIKNKPEVNGAIGKITGFDSTKGRYSVVCTNKYFSLLPTNFEVLPEPEELN